MIQNLYFQTSARFLILSRPSEWNGIIDSSAFQRATERNLLNVYKHLKNEDELRLLEALS